MEENKPFDYIKSYYQVHADLGRDVTVSGRLGSITRDMGNYIGVTFHDDITRLELPCHPTSNVVYLDTFTKVSTLKPKNSRSKQRYLDYLSSDSSLTFSEWMGIKTKAGQLLKRKIK